MEEIYLDIKGIDKLISKIKKHGESAVADVTRETINDVVYDMKGSRSRPGTMTKQAKKGFKHTRSKTFIPSMTGAQFARGKNINNLRAIAGVINKSNKTKAAEGLSRQHTRTPIDHTYAPLPNARTRKKEAGKVRKTFKHEERQDMDLTKVKKVHKMKLMMQAKRTKRTVLVKGKKGRKYVGLPGKIERFRNGNSRIKLRWLYAENPGKKANIKKANPFVNRGAKNSMRKADKYFKKNFDYIMKKYSKR